MKVIVAGTRTFTSPLLVSQAIAQFEACFGKITEVVCGGAEGVDALGAAWGNQCQVPVKTIPANWKLHGKSAGPRRNRAMAEYADALVLVWDGKSKGSANMKKEANARGLRICEVVIQ